MRRHARALLCAVLVSTACAGRVEASDPGAWRTFIRPTGFTDLLALENEVWGATRDGGLLRYVPATGAFDVIRREPGAIASNRLIRLAMDRSGQLWAGTSAQGVSRRRADGSRWDVVNILDGLPSDSVTVLETQGDTLWIGTARGVALWNGREIAGSLPDGFTVSFDTTFTSPRITGVAVLGDSLWLATPRGVGWARISALLTDWRPANAGLPATDVADLASDGSELFARVGTAVYRFRLDLGAWVVQAAPGVVRNLEDEAGVVLASGAAGLYRWRPQPSDTGWVRVADALGSLAGSGDSEPGVDPNGTYFAASTDTLYEHPAGAGAWIAHPAPSGPVANDLIHLAVDGPRLYVTSVGRGFSRFDGTSWRLWLPGFCGSGCDTDTTFVQPLGAFVVMVGRDGRKWIGSWSSPPYPGSFGPGGEIVTFDDSVSPPRFDHNVVVEDISQIDRMQRTWVLPGAVDSSGGIWFGSDTPAKGDVEPIGITHYDPLGSYLGSFDESNSTMSGRFVRGMTQTPNRRIWIGYSGQGLDFFTPPADSARFIHLTDTDNLVVRGVASRGDSVWILTNTELRLYDAAAGPTSTASQRLPVGGGQATFAFSPLAVGADGTVWAATTLGLRAFRPGGSQESFTTTNSPLPDDEVRSLAVDPASGALWMTTAGGLARFDPFYVAPPAPPVVALHVRVYPNPATTTALGLSLRLTGDAEGYRGEIFDLSGRRLRRFSAAVNGLAIWDGRDDDGRPVRPGLYFVRAEAGGRSAVARVVVLH